jgi:hypothetical protein
LFPDHESGTNDFDTKENATARYDTVEVEIRLKSAFHSYNRIVESPEGVNGNCMDLRIFGVGKWDLGYWNWE